MAILFGPEGFENGTRGGFDSAHTSTSIGTVDFNSASLIKGTYSLQTSTSGAGVAYVRKDLGTDAVSPLFVQSKFYVPSDWSFGTATYFTMCSLWTSLTGTTAIAFNVEDWGANMRLTIFGHTGYKDTGINLAKGQVYRIEAKVVTTSTSVRVLVWVNNTTENSPTYDTGANTTASGTYVWRYYNGGIVYADGSVPAVYADDFVTNEEYIGEFDASDKITFINKASNASTAATSITVNKPVDTAQGDVMLAQVFIEDTTDRINAVPSGWTEIVNATIGTRAIRQYVYYKVAGASEPANYQWGMNATDEIIGMIATYRNVDTTTPIGNKSTSTANVSSVSHTAPSITIQNKHNVGILLSGCDIGMTSTSPPNYIKREDLWTASGIGRISASMHTRQYIATGTTGDVTSTVSATSYYVASLVELVASDGSSSGSGFTADTESITITPYSATLNIGKLFSTETQSLAITGGTVSFARGKGISADTGELIITGNAITTNRGRILIADTAHIAITGADTSFSMAGFLDTSTSGLTISGNDVDFVRHTQIDTQTDSLSIDGGDTGLARGRHISADTAHIEIIGGDINFDATVKQNYILSTDTENVAISASDVVLSVSRWLTAETAHLDIIGNDISFSHGKTLSADTQNIEIIGGDVSIGVHKNFTTQTADIDIVGGDAFFMFLPPVYTTVTHKRFLYKMYDSSGNYIKTWDQNVILSAPQFTSTINSGLGELTISLALLESNYGEGRDIKYGNRIKVYCFDRDTDDSGVVIYSGILSRYTPYVRGNEEGVSVTFLSDVWECGRMMLLNGSATTVAYLTQDPSAIMRDLVDKFNARGGSVTYSGASIDNTSTSVSYTFNTNTFLEAMKKVLELAPLGWYFRIDPNDSLVHMHAKNTNADHTLAIGREISEYTPEKRVENIVNVVYFVGDAIFKKYQSLTSLNEYGEYAIKYVDNRVTVSATADIIADRILESQSSPEIRVVVKVMDNNGQMDGRGYDIESLKVGETVKIKNATSKSDNVWDHIEWDVDAWDYDITNAPGIALQIVSIEYTPEYAILELSNRLPDIAKRIEDINRNLVDYQTADNPSTPAV